MERSYLLKLGVIDGQGPLQKLIHFANVMTDIPGTRHIALLFLVVILGLQLRNKNFRSHVYPHCALGKLLGFGIRSGQWLGQKSLALVICRSLFRLCLLRAHSSFVFGCGHWWLGDFAACGYAEL